MITLKDLIDKLDLKPLTLLDPELEVSGCYCGDLLSWVMGRAKSGDAWLTVMGNVNAIAVASLADVACIILTENAALDDEAKEKALEHEINVLQTKKNSFETAVQYQIFSGVFEMKAYYDLHIHSCLSPCGDNDMTPNNLVNMAKLLGLDIIALTDHNSSRNCKAAMEVGREAGICVVPGMELTTSEEIHVVCLFPGIDQADQFNNYIDKNRMLIKNRSEIYGEQLILDHKDNVVGKEENLLIVSSNISVVTIDNLIKDFGGVCFPAHIEREGNGILSVLGDIPPESEFNVVEIKNREMTAKLRERHRYIRHLPIFHNSDAHYLENIKEKNEFIILDEISPECLIKTISDKNIQTG